MQQLTPLNEADNIIRNAVGKSINQFASKTELRDVSAKTTFMISPETYRKLIIVSKITGKSQQELYHNALDRYLQEDYLKDIDLTMFKEI